MAIGSWTGIYNRVIQELMEQSKDQELLLLLAIQKHCDPFGFAWPARITLMRLRHISQLRYQRRLDWLEEHHCVVVTESYDYQRRQARFDFQISPRVLYVRPEVQEYCEMVFDGIQERDFGYEKNFLEILFSTKESLPEVVPEPETRIRKPESGTSPKTRHSNQLSPSTRSGAEASTMRNGAKPEQRDSAKQRRPAQPQKDNPPTGGPAEFAALLDAGVDDGRIADEIVHVVSTTNHQAAAAVATYPREGIVHWLEMTARRRAKGELSKPGGWFFKMLQKHVVPLVVPGPNGQFNTSD